MKRRPITKSDAKRAAAAAIADAKERNRWSNADAGDVLGISEGTVRNRLGADEEPDKHQMTVYELARAIAGGEASLATRILRDLCGYHVAPDGGADAPTALDAAAKAARCAAELIAAAADGVDADEARSLLPRLVELQAELGGLEARFRELANTRPVQRIAL